MISAVAWWWWWLLQLQGEVKVFPTKGTLLRSSSWKVDIRNDSYGSSIFVFSSSNFIGNFVFTKKNYPISYFILSYLKIILQCIFSGIFLLKVDGNDMKVKKRGTTLTFFLIKLTEMTKMYNEDKLKIPIRKKF